MKACGGKHSRNVCREGVCVELYTKKLLFSKSWDVLSPFLTHSPFISSICDLYNFIITK